VATLVAKNANNAVVARIVGSGGVCIWLEYEVRRSVLCLCFLAGIWLQSLLMFSRLIYVIKKFNKCIFNAIFKHNATVNRISLLMFLPISIDGSFNTLLSVIIYILPALL
jgi:predicted neutral ceramidase superfamily lipid hydrolase